MNREVFVVMNNTNFDLEIKTFGIVIPSGQTVDLGDFDSAILSDEIFGYIQNGSLIRIINNKNVDANSSFYQSSESYTTAYNNIISVSKTGGTYTTIQGAIDSILDASDANKYLIRVGAGHYTENITMKNYVSIQGAAGITKVFGSINYGVALSGSSQIIDIDIESINAPAILVNTNIANIANLFNVSLTSRWSNNSAVQSVVDLQHGTLRIAKSTINLYNLNSGATDGYIDTIYHLHGVTPIDLECLYSDNNIHQYNNNNATSLYYCTNTNTDKSVSFFKDGSVSTTLHGSLPANKVLVFTHSGSTTITTVDNFYMDLTSVADISTITYMPAYNNYSVAHDVSGTTIGSEIYTSFCTINWDQVKIPDNVVYLGCAIAEIDYVDLMSFIFNTNFDVIPEEYTVEGVNSGLTVDISNSWGSYYNSSSIKTSNLIVGSGGIVISDISNDSGLTASSVSTIPTQQSVKYYVDSKTNGITVVHANLLGLSADDHLQYLKADGTRSVSGVMKYNSGLTFSSSEDIVSKQYVDDSLLTKSNTGHSHTEFNSLTIHGDLFVSGTTTTVYTENMVVKDNIMLINSGETNAGVTGVISGIEIDRGPLDNYQIVFDEATDAFKVGIVGNLQPVATREESPVNGNIVVWDSINARFSASITPSQFASSAHTHSVADIVDIESYTGFTNYYTKSSVYTKGETDGLISSVTANFIAYTGSTGLAEVTAINAQTSTESTFSGGIVTGSIRALLNSTTAIQIKNSAGQAKLTLDTVSGFTGFGTTPNSMIHVYGRDNSQAGDAYGNHTNRIFVDGVSDGDKDITLADDGTPKWTFEIYRGEKGKYLYLYNQDGESNQLVASDTGRMGVNTRSNLMDRIVSTISGNTYNGIVVSGVYDKNYIGVYQIKIVGVSGATNTFAWRVSKDLSNTYSNWSAPIACSTTPIQINSGVEVTCIQTSGYTVGDTWRFTAFPQLPVGTLAITPNRIYSSLKTSDYTAGSVEYIDITSDVNTSVENSEVPIFEVGTTTSAIYFGGTTQLESISVNVKISAVGVTLVVEYWNGASWIDISVSSDFYNDGTSNLTQKGTITWNSTTMTGWVMENLPNTTEDYYKLYWVRLRTASPPSVQPTAINFSRSGEYRLVAMNSAYDYRPSFYVDTFGRTSIGGGNITGTNLLQINSSYNILPLGAVPSLVEIDSEDSNVADLKIKLSSSDAVGVGLNLSKTRGTLSSPLNIEPNDMIGHVSFRSLVNGNGLTLAQINATYTGNGTTQYADIVFKAHNSSDLVEKMRITSVGVGVGVSTPSAWLHLAAGSALPSTAPLKFISGDLMATPEAGAVEFSNDAWFGTTTTGRKTFAFLESPTFTGTPSLPESTLFGENMLIEIIQHSGGTSNPSLLNVNTFIAFTGTTNTRLNAVEANVVDLSGETANKLDKSTFYAYTGSTIPWSQVDKSISSIADIATRNSSDIAYTNTAWNVSDVKASLDQITDNIENVVGSGRVSPIIVLGGLNTKTLWVSGGTGFMNYQNYHRTISWSGVSFDITAYSANTYYVYVNNNSTINISNVEPDKLQNIYLGQFYYDGWFIITIQQSSNISDKSLYRMTEYTIRVGGFIYDNGGSILATGTTQRIVSPPCKVQYGLLDYNLSEINTYNNSGYTASGMYQSSDLYFNIDYYFLESNAGTGKIPNNRYNVITNPSNYKLTGHTLTFTQNSNIVTSDSNLTGLITDDHYIYLDNSAYMVPVSSVTWSGSSTTITLEDIYLGASGSGETSIDKCLPKLPSGKWVKHLVVRTTSDNMAIIYGQQYFDTQAEALNGAIPSIPPTLVSISIKMATIVVNSGITDYSEKDVITDIRPLPFTYRTSGGGGGGTSATAHGALTGLMNDDHPQYLLTNGARAIAGVISYDSEKTFTNDNNLISKKYADDGLMLKVNLSDYNTFTGATLPANYYNKTEINAFTGNTYAIYNDTLEPTGFINTDNIIVSYNSIARTITLSASTGSVEYYWRGTKHSLGDTWTSVAHDSNSAATWYLYSNDGINISWSNSGWTFDALQVALIPANADWALRETHGTMPYAAHKEFHQVIGTYKASGFGLTIDSYNIKPATPTDADNTPHFNSGIIADEDLNTTIPAWNYDVYTHLYFTDAGTPVFLTGQTNIFRSGNTYPLYNNNNGNGFGETEMLDNYYANYYVIRIPVAADANSQKYGTIILQPQYQYTTLIAAEGENTKKILLGGLANLSPEFVMVEKITLRTNSAYTEATGHVRIESIDILSTTRFGQLGTSSGEISIAAENVTVKPSVGFTSVDLQGLSDEYATAIGSKLSISNFVTFTGTTLPANYYSKVEIALQSGETYAAIALKADLLSPALSGTPTSTTAIADTNSTQIATTAFVVGQASATSPLMNGTAAIGTSLRYSRADHVHPTDSSRLSISAFEAFTGTTLPNSYYSITFTDSLLLGKSNTGHSHVTSDITNLSTYSEFTNYYTNTAVNALLDGKSSTGHTHATNDIANLSTYSGFTNYYTSAIVNALLNGKSNTGHSHATSDITNLSTYSGFTNYYIKAETDAQLIKGIAVDATNIGSNRPLVYDAIAGKIVYKTLLDTPPTTQIRRTSTLVVPITWTNVTFDTIDVESNAASIHRDTTNTDRVYVANSGYYEIKFQAKSLVSTTTTKVTCQFLINGNTYISGSTAFINSYTSEIHPLISVAQVYLTGGSYVVAQVISSTATNITLTGDTILTVTKMDGIVGARGATGSGSNITIQHNSANIPNTPHSVLNYTGNAVTVADAGNGVATISINESLYGTEFQYVQDFTTTTTTSVTPTYSTKITLKTTVLAGGTYKISVAYGVNKNNITSDLLSRVTVDGTIIGSIQNHELSDTATYLYTARVFYTTLSAASHTILLQFSNEGSGTISVRDASIELIRVS